MLERKEKDRGPTPWECTAVLRSLAKNDVDKLLTAAENGTILNRDQVAKVNRYLVSYTLLLLASRPSAAEELTVKLVEHGLQHNHVKDSEGNDVLVIVSSGHKTGEGYMARIILEGYILNYFERYTKFVRPQNVERTASVSKAFFLQNNGTQFTKVSEAPVKLQREYICPEINNGQARKSVETYVQCCSVEQTSAMATFLCHTKTTRDKFYVVGANEKAADSYRLLLRMNNFYKSNPRTSITGIFSGVDGSIAQNKETASSPRLRSMDASPRPQPATSDKEKTVEGRRRQTKEDNLQEEISQQQTDDEEQPPATVETIHQESVDQDPEEVAVKEPEQEDTGTIEETATVSKRRKGHRSELKSPLKGSPQKQMNISAKANVITTWIVKNQGDLAYAKIEEGRIKNNFV